MGMRLVFDKPRHRHRYSDDNKLDLDDDIAIQLLELLKKKKETKDKKKEEHSSPSMSFGTALLLMSILGPSMFLGTAYGGSYVIVNIVHMWQGVLH